jgi:hypothetical protein
VPAISRFFGIIVRIYAEAGEQHHRPHFHAYYHDDVVIYGIEAIEALAGSLPRRQQRLVEAWASSTKRSSPRTGHCCRMAVRPIRLSLFDEE